jgi:ubiquinone/menaquinone biosynthesis C-methylase UbiE
MTMKDQFKDKAKNWDEIPWKQNLAQDTYNAISSKIKISSNTRLIDLGGGTGLLTLKFKNDVSKITIVDTSKGMLDVLKQKIEAQKINNVEILNGILSPGVLPKNSSELIISMMTLHHIEDLHTLFKCFYEILVSDGSIALVDLAKEDGDFHDDGIDYVYDGFEKEDLTLPLEKAGFKNIGFAEISKVTKESASGLVKEYPILLVTASK